MPDYTDETAAKAFLAYCDTQLALQRAEQDYAAAVKTIEQPLIEARVANKAARNALAEQMQARGVERVVL